MATQSELTALKRIRARSKEVTEGEKKALNRIKAKVEGTYDGGLKHDDLVSWFTDAESVLTGASDYYKANEGKWVDDYANYGGQFTDSINSLRDRLENINYYLNAHAKDYENSSGLLDAVTQYTNMFDEIEAQNAAAREFYSQFSGADDYNAFLQELANKEKWDTMKNSPEGDTGWQQYLADEQALLEAEQAAQEEETFWEKLGRWLGGGGGVVDTTLPNAGVSQTIQDLRNDDSYKKPTEQWNAEEKRIFGYLYLNNPKEAFEYATSVNNAYNRTAEEARIAEIKASSSSSFGAGLLNTVGAIASSTLGLADYLSDLAMANAGRDITYDGYVSPFEYSQAVTSGISESLNQKYGTISDDAFLIGGRGVGDLYGLGSSILQSIASAYTLGGAGTLVSYFGQGAASGVDDALSRGATDEQAVLYGLAVGTFEGVAEQIGIDNLFKTGSSTTIKGILKNILNQAKAEGLEEGLTSLFTNIADNVIMQDKSVFNQLVAEYMAQGMSEEDAKKKAWIKSASDIAYDTIAGSVSGSVSGGLRTGTLSTISNINAKRNFSNQAESLLSEAGTLADSKATVERYAKDFKKKGRLSGGALNELLDITDTAKVKSAVEAQLTKLGESGDISQLAEIITKQTKGTELTKKEQQILDNSKFGKRVVNTLDPSKIKSGRYDTRWAEGIGTRRLNAGAYNKTLYDLAQAQAEAQGKAEANAVTNTVAEAQNAIENKYEVSTDGGTIYHDGEKDEAVKVMRIASADNGRVMVELDNGNTVDASKLSLSSAEEGVMYEMLARMEAPSDTANEIMNTFKPADVETAKNYYANIPLAYEYGLRGYEAGLENVELSPEQKKLVYNRGRMDAMSKVESKAQAKTEVKAEAKTEVKTEANTKKDIIYEGDLNYEKATSNGVRKASMAGIEFINSISNLEVHLFESYVNADGERVYSISGREGAAPNGYFTDGNKIYIDINAGNFGEGVMLYTLSHEISHYIAQWNGKGFKILGDFLLEQYGKTGAPVTALLKEQRDKIKRRYQRENLALPSEAKLNDMAYEELVADAMSEMLADPKAYEKLAKLKQENRTVWQKLGEAIKKLINKIKSILGEYKKYAPDASEAHEVRRFAQDMYDKLQDLYLKAFVEADANYGASTEATTDANGLAEIDVKSESVAPIVNSERTWTSSEYVTMREEAAKKIAKALNVSKETARKYIDDVNSIAKMIANDRARLDYEASSFGSAFVSNVEYGGSFDYTTLCKKRRLYTGTFTEIQKRLKDTALTPDDILTIRNMLIEAGDEATCGLCYVEGSRANMGKFAKEFIRLYKRDNPNAWIPNMADVNTPDGVEKMRINHPEVYERYEYFWNHYGKLKDSDPALFASQQKPKLYEARKEYKGEILEHFKNDSSVERKNLNGGIRMQSFSDFEIVHLIDTMQVIMDMATVGLAGQAYTKVPEFAKAFGNTGLKINLSLIAKGVDADGNLIFDDREGMPHETAFELRDKYSKNVGTIIVAFTDEQLIAAMADPRIDYIIPFHRSQWKKGQYGAMGLPKGTKDYTFMQNEKLIKKTYHEYNGRMVLDKATNYMPNEYWDFSKSGKENAEAYLKMCAENNKRPKFYKLLDYDGNGTYSLKADGSTDGYWKLLIDFKMYDNDGVGSPQMAVTPTFNMDEATTMLDEYKGGHSSYPVAYEVVDKFVEQYEGKSETKFSDRDSHGNTLTKEQQKFFEESRAKDEDGNLLVLYHGTKAEQRIAVFKTTEGWRTGLWLTTDYKTAVEFAKKGTKTSNKVFTKANRDDGGDGQGIYEMYANAKKPLIVDAQGKRYWEIPRPDVMGEGSVVSGEEINAFAFEKGYDSVIIKDVIEGSGRLGTDVVVFSSNQVKYTDNLNPTEVRDISYSERSSYAPTFYSHMGNVINDIKLEKMGANGVVSYLKGKGVKNEEIKWSGIEDYLDGKKSVTKAELQEFVAGSQLVIEEQIGGGEAKLTVEPARASYGGESNDVVVKRGNTVLAELEWDEFNETYESKEDDMSFDDEDEILAFYNNKYGAGETRWEQYKLDGGENYREITFAMPDSTYSNQAMRAHWGEDAEGIIAHARIQDMTTKDGKKMLFIEEIQSDWHNAGRKNGYEDKNDKWTIRIEEMYSGDEYVRLYINGEATPHFYPIESFEIENDEGDVVGIKSDAEIIQEIRKYLSVNGAAPDAPFRDNYQEYVLKRLLRMAAEEGYDSIGWTTADIQSERWSDQYAEGYRIEYDQEIPKFLRKYGKKWGATVGKTMLDTGNNYSASDIPRQRANLENLRNELSQATDIDTANSIRQQIRDTENEISRMQALGGEVWSMDITDSMAQSVLYEGQTKFSERDTEGMSNRSVLANALEGTIDTSTAEGKFIKDKLSEYKKVIATIEKLEIERGKMIDKAKELQNTKGKTPDQIAEMKSLWAEARKIANNIVTYDRQLLRIEAMKPIKSLIYREKAALKRVIEQKGREALKAQKEKAEKKAMEIITHYRESRMRATEGRHKTEMRHKIQRVVNELNQYLLNGTKEKHVPIELQKVVAEALDVVNMDTVGAEERIAKKREEMLNAKTPEQIEKIAKEIERIAKMGGNMDEKLSRLKTAYDSIINSTDPLIANSHDEVISNTIEKVIEVVGDTPLRDMSLWQLETIYDMYKMVLHSIRSANKAFKAKKSEEISTIANKVLTELDKQKKRKQLTTKAGEVASEFSWNNEKPVYAFERLGSETFTEVFNNVRAGEDTWATDMTEAREFLESAEKKYNFDKWDFAKKYEFVSTTGKKFELTLGHILSIYAYSKRGEQAVEHLRKGGFVFDGVTEVKQKNKLGITRTYQLKDATAYNLSDKTIMDIIAKLSDEQKAFANEMQKYLSTTMGDKGNEVSLELYGIKLFNEKDYFPLRSAPQYLERAREQANGDVKIKNKGFTKETTPHASNPVVLTSFMDVWAGHVNEMSMYHSFTLPLEDFYRVFNYKTLNTEETDTIGVIPFIENAHGSAAVSYIDQLLKDLNGGARSDPRETLGKRFMSRFKKSAVMGSLSVIVQQPTAIVRAMALVKPKYFGVAPITRGVIKAFNRKKHKALWAEVKKYAPVAIIKEMGYFDTGMGQSSVEWLKGEKKFMDKVDDVLTKLPSVADELGWISIWEAVKRETAANNPALNTSSEKFLKMAGERFTEVIIKTQVYDSTLAKSANMRSKSALMNMWTAFMAEPTTTINMVTDAFRKKDGKYIARVLGATFGSVALNAALVSLVYAMRDDDEDETFTEKYLSRFTTELVDGVNPITYIPFFKDIWSIMQGFDIERADMALVTDLVDTMQSVVKVIAKDTSDMTEEELAEHEKAVADALWGIVDSLTNLAGIPEANIRRDIDGIVNLFKTLGRDMDTTYGSLMDNIAEDLQSSVPVWGWLPGESKTDKLYDAIISGDTAYVDRLRSAYKSEEAYESALRKALREHDSRIVLAAEAWVGRNTAEYSRIVNEIVDEGLFDKMVVKGAVEYEVNKMSAGEDDGSSEDKFESIYDTEHYYFALMSGDTSTAEAVKRDIIDTAIANGDEPDEAEDKFYTALRRELRDAYAGGEIDRTRAMDWLMAHGDKDRDEAYWELKKWDYYATNGTVEGYSKYTALYDAVKTGKNLKAVIKEHTTNGDKTSELASQITRYYKPLYREMTRSERASIKGYLLNAYSMLGYNRAEKSKDIDKWLED